MKKLLLGALLLLSMLVFCQDRQIMKLPSIKESNGRILTNATGWSFCNGKWNSGLNKIPKIEESNTEIDNFISYEIRDININDIDYLLLIKKEKSCWWDYPNIHSGYHSNIDGQWFVIDKEQFKNIKVNDDVNNIIEFKCIYSGEFDNSYYRRSWIDKICMDKIKKEINESLYKSENSTETLVFHLIFIKSKNIVRFQIYSYTDGPKEYNSYDDYASGNFRKTFNIGLIKNEFKPLKKDSDLYSKQIYKTDELFSYCYFETNYLLFSKLIILK